MQISGIYNSYNSQDRQPAFKLKMDREICEFVGNMYRHDIPKLESVESKMTELKQYGDKGSVLNYAKSGLFHVLYLTNHNLKSFAKISSTFTKKGLIENLKKMNKESVIETENALLQKNRFSLEDVKNFDEYPPRELLKLKQSLGEELGQRYEKIVLNDVKEKMSKIERFQD